MIKKIVDEHPEIILLISFFIFIILAWFINSDPKCAKEGCNNDATYDSAYCWLHKPYTRYPSYGVSSRDYGPSSSTRQSTTNSSSNKNTNSNSSTYKTTKYKSTYSTLNNDPDDYDDPEDYADDAWGDDFDDWDDAYDFWEDY